MRLFEFEMLEEGISQVLNVKKMCVLINDHLGEQAAARNIPMDVVYQIIKKIPNLRNKLKPFPENTKITIWSKSLNAGVGIRTRLEKDGYQRIEVMTAINQLYDSDVTTFQVG